MSFLTPALAVAGVGLVAIPVLIHLLNRRRYKTVRWAAMKFLLRAMKKNRRRLRFESWLLLATRCLLVLLAGLALARPLGCGSGTLADLAGRPAGLHVIVVDNSASMGYRHARGEAATNLEHAKVLARGLIDRLSAGGERVALVTTAEPAAAVFAGATFDLDAAADAVASVGQTAAAGDLAGALALALEAAEGSDEPTRNLHLITDSGAAMFDDPRLAEFAAGLGERFSAVVHHDVSAPEASNAAVVTLVPEDGLLRAGFADTLTARVAGFGGVGTVEAGLSVDGEPAGEPRPVEPTPAGVPVRATPGLSGGGRHVAEAALLRGDALPVDDRRWAVLDVAAELPVLIVEGRRGMTALEGSGAFLDVALAPPAIDDAGLRGSASYVETERISDLELSNKILADYRAVYLAGVGGVSPAAAGALRAYVEDGGTLFVLMGEAVTAANYNDALGSAGLLPGPLVRLDAEPTGFAFDATGVVHPYLQAFARVEGSGFDTTSVGKHWVIDPADGSETVLAYKTGDPAILRHRVGDGEVLTLTTAADADTSWSDLASRPVFVSLMHELLARTADGGADWLNLAVSERVVAPRGAGLAAGAVLRLAGGGSVPLVAGEDGRFRSPPVGEPGLHRVESAGATWPVAVNVPAAESDVRRTDPAGMRAALGGVELTAADDALPTATAEGGRAADFGWTLLAIMLALAAAECVMAMKFGRTGGDAPAGRSAGKAVPA